MEVASLTIALVAVLLQPTTAGNSQGMDYCILLPTIFRSDSFCFALQALTRSFWDCAAVRLAPACGPMPAPALP
jgi:hypothetical protein